MDTEPIIVKIAVKMESKDTQFIEFILNENLSIIIKSLCTKWDMIQDNQYAFKFENHESYVTEQNKTQIKNGSVLILTYSSSKMANDIIKALK